MTALPVFIPDQLDQWAGWTAQSARTSRLLGASARPARVTALLGVIVLLSLLDLVLTVGCMTGSGMFESNPIVAWLAAWSGSAWTIVHFKALSVLVGVSLLHRTRRHASAELAAWLMTAILTALAIRWMMYTGELAGVDPGALLALAGADTQWIHLP